MENVLAKVNGKEITVMDRDNLLRSLGQERAAQFQGKEGEELILNELINQELFYFDAVATDLENDDLYKAEMEKAKTSILKQMNIQKTLSDIKITDDAVKEYFEANKDMFMKPEEVVASHILVTEEDEINEVVSKIDAGMSFEDAAREFSTCPSKAQGGDLGAFTRGRMVPEFEQTAFELEMGKISAPVKTQFGYHVIKVTSKNESQNQEFEAVQAQINQELTIKKQNEVYLNKVEELKANYSIEILN